MHPLGRRPVLTVRAADVRCQDGEVRQIARAQARPAVQLALPLRRDRAAPPPRAEQTARDRRDRVGIPTAADRLFQSELQVSSLQLGRDGHMRDRRPRALQRLDDPAVLREVAWTAALGDVEAVRPHVTAVDGKEGDAAAHVELSHPHGVTDRERPQHARIPGVVLAVGEVAHGPCRGREGGLVVGAGIGEQEEQGANQGRITDRAALSLMHLAHCVMCRRGGRRHCA